MNKSITILLMSAVIILSASALLAITLHPVSYSMLNGQSGSFNYWDEIYSGTGNPYADLSPLSGGLGDLTDGIIATQMWYYAEKPAGNGPYVGWYHSPIDITFYFSQSVLMNNLTIYVDDPNGWGGVYIPKSVDITMSGSTQSYSINDPPSNTPLGITFNNLNLTGNSLQLSIHRSKGWVFLSEVTFEGSPIPEPGTFILLGAGLIGIAAFRRKYKK